TTAYIAYSLNGARQLREVGDFLTIGRDNTNHLSLNDDYVSGRHARIEKRDQGFFVRDLRSRNGTYLNGSQVSEARLKDGDRLRFGNSDLSFTSTKEFRVNAHNLQSKNVRWQTELARLPHM